MKRKLAFTLVEIIVVIAIIAVLAAILVPVAVRARASGQETECLMRMRQVYIALKLYSEDHGSVAPPAPGLVPLAPYAKSEAVYQCQVEHSIKPRADGQYRAQLLDLTENGPPSPFRISYGYLGDTTNDTVLGVWSKLGALSKVGVIACPWHAPLKGEQNPLLKHLQPRAGVTLRICNEGSAYKWQKLPTHTLHINADDLYFLPYSSRELFGP